MLSKTVVLGEERTLILPVELCEVLGLAAGTELVAKVEGGRLILEPRQSILEELQALFDDLPPDVSLVEQLLEERRREVEHDLRS